MDESIFSVTGADISQFKSLDEKNSYELVLSPTGNQQISVQIKRGATMSKKGDIPIDSTATFFTVYDPKKVQ